MNAQRRWQVESRRALSLAHDSGRINGQVKRELVQTTVDDSSENDELGHRGGANGGGEDACHDRSHAEHDRGAVRW